MADSFHNVRLSKRVLVNARGGPGFKTNIVETASGDEYRNVEWSKTRGKWEIAYTDDIDVIREIMAFFYARRGRAYGFRFRDWSDYHVDGEFAAGDGTVTVFQAAKVYVSGAYSFSRPLTRLVAPVTVYRTPKTGTDGGGNPTYGDRAVVASGVTVDVDKGTVTFAAAPADGDLIGIACEFDVPVRFDVDELSTTMISQDLVSLDSVPIIEIRDRSTV